MNAGLLPHAGHILRLNRAQRNAVDAMQDGWDGSNGEFVLPIVEGPPGTGKTHVGVLAATRYVREDERTQVAYVAYTNYAADRAQSGFFEAGLEPHEVLRLTPDRSQRDWDRGVIGCDPRLEELTPNERRRVGRARVLISTLHSAPRIFNVMRHPLVVVDEYSQVSPAMFFLLLSNVRRTSGSQGRNPSGYALLGDPNQLPVITSQPLLRPNIGNFLLARKPGLESHQLVDQYRMHDGICRAVNALREALHTYELKSDPSVQSRDLQAMGYRFDPGASSAMTDVLSHRYPLVLIDTDSLPGEESSALNQSKCYDEEARLAAEISTALHKAYTTTEGRRLETVTLSPYTAQVSLISSYLPSKQLRTNCITVYKSQGREYPAVVVSFVRKNPLGNIGFLGEPELHAQTYVACSRAQAKLILLFSFKTFKGNPDFGTLLERCHTKALVVEGSDIWGGVS